MVKPTLYVADDAADDAVADRLTLERGRHGGNKRIPVSRVERGGGVGDGKELWLA